MSEFYLWASAVSGTILLALLAYLTSKRDWKAAALLGGMFAAVWLPGFLLRLFEN